MPVTPDGKIIDASGNPTGQTVDLKTGALSGVQTSTQTPATQTTPAINSPTPGAPAITPPTTPATTTAPTPTTPPPSTNLQPGAQGQDVTQLQNFLKSLGFLTSQQIATGPGIYGPQTTAAVSKLQQSYGVNPGQYPGYYGPLTRQALSNNNGQPNDQALNDKYQGAFDDLKNKSVPNSNAEASTTIAGNTKEDPQKTFLDSYFAMNPMVKSLYDTLNNTLSSSNTKQSFVDEFNQLRTAQGVPGLQTDLLNINNVMKGTEQDIRDEITKAGGFATESQVMAMTGQRNRILLKQANYISDVLNAKDDYVNQVMKLSGADREQVNKQLDRQIGLTEHMATIQNDITNAARTNYEKIVDRIGYDGLAKETIGDPNRQRYIESLLGLKGGDLSNPDFIANAKTFKEQTLSATLAQRDIVNELAKARLAQGAQRINITLGEDTSRILKPTEAAALNVPFGTTVGEARGITPLTSATRTMVEAAPNVLRFVDRIESEVNNAEKGLGPVASRWREFTAGRIGFEDPAFTEIRTNVGLLSTLLMRMHVGARGGEQIMKHFQGLIQSGTQSPANLKASLEQIRDYATSIQQEGKPQNNTSTIDSDIRSAIKDTAHYQNREQLISDIAQHYGISQDEAGKKVYSIWTNNLKR